MSRVPTGYRNGVGGRAVDVEAAFEMEFGASATALVESFQQFLVETQGDPAGRLAGMMWDQR